MPIIIPDVAASPSDRESLILDGVELNSIAGDYVLRSIDLSPPKKRMEWATGADTDGAALVRDPLVENRTITCELRVAQQASMDAAVALIWQVVSKLEEAEQQPDGLPLVYTPAGATQSVTYYVLTGEITGLPITRTGDLKGWLMRYPIIQLSLTCKPYGYGTEVLTPAVTASTPIVTVTLPAIGGDVPAEGRLIVTDAATQSRRHLEWGLEQRYLNLATSLQLNSASLVTSGFAGASTTRAGSFNANVVRATVLTQPVAVCGTGTLTHVGTYRVKARVYVPSTTGNVRLTWQDGDGPFSANAYATPIANAWCEIDLGLISITPATTGTQAWSGRIEATGGASVTVDIDYLIFVPAGEGYGKARASYTYTAGVISGHDEFTGMSGGTALNARTAAAGGTWASAGDATDYTASAINEHSGASSVSMSRAAVSDAAQGRLAILGATTYTDVETAVYFLLNNTIGTNTVESGVLARYVDTSNYLRAYVLAVPGATSQFILETRIAGVAAVIATAGVTVSPVAWYGIRIVAFSSGKVTAKLLDTSANVLLTVSATSTALATGGALATGKAGFQDRYIYSTAIARYYDDFYAGTPAAEPIVVYSGRQAEVRHNAAIRQNAAGTTYGPFASYRGGRFMLPVAGDKGRPVRVLTKLRRTDVDVDADTNVTDSTTVQIAYTPRWYGPGH